MSMHIMYTHQCSSCEAYYLPYKKGVNCPKCGLEAEEVYEVISELAKSANYQFGMNGYYTPLAWWNGSYADNVALFLFKLFDAYFEQNAKSFEDFSYEYINVKTWEEDEYVKGHIYEISCEVFKLLERG